MTYESNSSRTIHLSEHLSDKKLTEILVRCEEAVTKGTAQMHDYKTFVSCAEELTRRTGLRKTG